MMGDQQHEGVIPKAVGEIYDYIEKVCAAKIVDLQVYNVQNARSIEIHTSFIMYTVHCKRLLAM